MSPDTDKGWKRIRSSTLIGLTTDLNHDGRTDLVFFSLDHTVSVSLSNGNGTFQSPVNAQLGKTLNCPFASVVTGDVNGDGNANLVLAYPGDAACGSYNPVLVSSGYFVLLGKGDGTFHPAAFTAYPVPIVAIALAAFHGTLKPLDLVIAYDGPGNYVGGAKVSIATGAGDGTFGAPADILTSCTVSNINTSDFNSDGKLDLTLSALCYDSSTTLFSAGLLLLPGDGGGSFGPSTYIAGDTSLLQLNQSGNIGIGLYGDLNGDGILDLLYTSADGLSVRLGRGTGEFAPAMKYPWPGGQPLLGNFLADNALSIISTGFAPDRATALFMNQGGTTLALTPSATNIAAGQALTLAAALTPTVSNRPQPTGTLTFYDGQTAIGTGALANGAYTFTAPALAAGTHTLSVAYSGDANFQANRSANVSVTVTALAPDYSISSSTTSLTVSKGTRGTVTLNLAVNLSLSGQLTFACAGLPAEASCSFSPASLTVAAGQTASDTLTISIKAASTSARTRVAADRYVLPRGLVLAGLLVFFLPFRRRRGVLFTLSVLLALGSFAGLSGCAGSNATTTPTPITDPGTPTGSSIVTVTATAVSGGTTITHDLTINLIVQ